MHRGYWLDNLWTGEVEEFARTAALNLDSIRLVCCLFFCLAHRWAWAWVVDSPRRPTLRRSVDPCTNLCCN